MYTLESLSDETGYPVRTIRLYRRRGLVSPPMQRPNYRDRAVWGDLHIRELRLVRKYQDGNMTLDDIRDAIHHKHEAS